MSFEKVAVRSIGDEKRVIWVENHFPFREKYFQLDSLLLTWNPENLRKTAIPIPGILAALRHGPMNQQEFETNKYGVWKGVPVITYLGKIGTFT